MAKGICFKFDAIHEAVVVLLVLEANPGLANCTGASIEGVIVARRTGCSSRMCLLFDPFEPRSLQQRRLHKNYDFGTAMNYPGLEWS